MNKRQAIKKYKNNWRKAFAVVLTKKYGRKFKPSRIKLRLIKKPDQATAREIVQDFNMDVIIKSMPSHEPALSHIPAERSKTSLSSKDYGVDWDEIEEDESND